MKRIMIALCLFGLGITPGTAAADIQRPQKVLTESGKTIEVQAFNEEDLKANPVTLTEVLAMIRDRSSGTAETGTDRSAAANTVSYQCVSGTNGSFSLRADFGRAYIRDELGDFIRVRLLRVGGATLGGQRGYVFRIADGDSCFFFSQSPVEAGLYLVAMADRCTRFRFYCLAE